MERVAGHTEATANVEHVSVMGYDAAVGRQQLSLAINQTS